MHQCLCLFVWCFWWQFSVKNKGVQLAFGGIRIVELIPVYKAIFKAKGFPQILNPPLLLATCSQLRIQMNRARYKNVINHHVGQDLSATQQESCHTNSQFYAAAGWWICWVCLSALWQRTLIQILAEKACKYANVADDVMRNRPLFAAPGLSILTALTLGLSILTALTPGLFIITALTPGLSILTALTPGLPILTAPSPFKFKIYEKKNYLLIYQLNFPHYR